MSSFEEQVVETQKYLDSPRFKGIKRLYSARQVVEQRGSIPASYAIAQGAAEAFYARLRELFDERKSITTFGPYSPGQAVAMKRMGIEGIYLGGWATSAKGSIIEDPGPDLASYPLSQVPDEAAGIVRALLTADRNQVYNRSRMTAEKRAATREVDYRPFIIADADTGHGGDAHVRNLIRRFVEVGVPGYHIEDQRPGSKKCGHQGGKVLVTSDEQIKRLNSARFQLDIMKVPGMIVARTDAESATLLESNGDERDQPFILGATNIDLPTYKVANLAVLRKFYNSGVAELNGFMLYSISDEEYAEADTWLERAGVTQLVQEGAARFQKDPATNVDAILDKAVTRMADVWIAEAGMKTYARAVADVMEFRHNEGEEFPLSVEEWLHFAERASFNVAKNKARSMGIHIIWDCERSRTVEGYYQVQGGIEYSIHKSLAAAPFADLLWMETKTADLKDAKEFADAIHAKFPDKMLAYNLSPSFNWDTTGMTDEQMRAFPEELGKMGFVFNFITYGGHQIDGLAGEEFALALKQEGMLALARLQRKFRLVESPYSTPQTLVGGPRLDGALGACTGRTTATKAMGKGSTQFQHLVQTEVPTSLLQEWLNLWSAHYKHPQLKVELRPNRAGSDLLELRVLDGSGQKLANVVFGTIQDRRGRSILSVRDQNTFDVSLRKKRLMALLHLFLIHRYKSVAVHYLSPTEDNQYQCERMQRLGIYSQVNNEVGEIIVADIDTAGVAKLLQSDRVALKSLIEKESGRAPVSA
ncbi:MAG: isocitrate lyase ICL2 [Pirellulales bacterium]|nr:isocitrate lyase ICL2 [Pirellulales bacterium]